MNNQIKRCIMRAILAACVVITVSCASTAAQSSSQSNAVNERQRIYMAHLQKNGYSPTLDDGLIFFRSEGLNYYIAIDSEDPALFYILLPIIKYINSDEDRIRAAKAVSAANRGVKVAKAFIVDSQNQSWVTISAEMFLENPDHFAVLFERLLNTTIIAKMIFDENF